MRRDVITRGGEEFKAGTLFTVIRSLGHRPRKDVRGRKTPSSVVDPAGRNHHGIDGCLLNTRPAGATLSRIGDGRKGLPDVVDISREGLLHRAAYPGWPFTKNWARGRKGNDSAPASQNCIIDPIGVWWGLRSSADGSAAGLPIVIFGGDHADIPINADMGEIVAGVVLDRVSAILDLSSFKRSEQDRFVEHFTDHLYQRRKQGDTPSLIIVDEAHSFIPQRPMPDQTRVLGAMERLVRHGRVKGLGVAVASQRAASVNKSVLNLCELLFAMRTSATIDRKTVDDWLSGHVSEEQRKEVLASIAGLDVGETYYSSAAFLHAFGRVRIRQRHTYDSSATPKVGEARRQPKTLADVDIDRLRVVFEEIQVEVTANDPNQLKAMIVDLRKQLADRPPERVEVPVIDPDQLDQLKTSVEDIIGLGKDLIAVGNNLAAVLGAAYARTGQPLAAESPKLAPAIAPKVAPSIIKQQQKLLDTLHSFSALGVTRVPKTVIAVVSGVSPRSSSFDANLRDLRNNNLIDANPHSVALTEAGRLTPWTTAKSTPTLAQYRRTWIELLRLTPGQQSLFRSLVATTGWIRREDLAVNAKVSPTSSSLDSTLRLFRDLGLVEFGTNRNVRATKLLSPEGLH